MLGEDRAEAGPHRHRVIWIAGIAYQNHTAASGGIAGAKDRPQASGVVNAVERHPGQLFAEPHLGQPAPALLHDRRYPLVSVSGRDAVEHLRADLQRLGGGVGADEGRLLGAQQLRGDDQSLDRGAGCEGLRDQLKALREEQPCVIPLPATQQALDPLDLAVGTGGDEHGIARRRPPGSRPHRG